MNSIQFICKCGKVEGWVTEDENTQPCPNCGRIYRGKYNFRTYSIDIIEITNEK